MSLNLGKPYVGDKNNYQYGSGICGLAIVNWQMGIKWNSSNHWNH